MVKAARPSKALTGRAPLRLLAASRPGAPRPVRPTLPAQVPRQKVAQRVQLAPRPPVLLVRVQRVLRPPVLRQQAARVPRRKALPVPFLQVPQAPLPATGPG